MFATLDLPLRDDNRHKRLKVGRACHPCRMKKIKCDGKQPCMQCKARRRKCMYLKNTEATYIKLDPDDTQSLTNEEAEDDQLFQQTPTTTNHTATITRSDKMMEQLSEGLVQLTLHQDLSGLKKTVAPWQNYGDFVRWTSEPMNLPDHYTGSLEMPAKGVQEQLIQVFFSHCHTLLPTMSKSMFYDQLHSKGPLITPLLLNMIYAHASAYQHAHEQPPPPLGIPAVSNVYSPSFSSTTTDADQFYQRARQLLDDFMDVPRISTVIALLYMVSYEDNTQLKRSSRAWMYSGMAIRMCLELGLHTCHYSSQMSQFDIELRKRVLWTCYVMDKLESCTMERPWMLRSQDISLDLPTPLPEDDQQERNVLEGFSHLCRLMMLVEKVLFFFTNDGGGDWTTKKESQVIYFMDKLTQWRDMLPEELKWHPHALPSTSIVANLHLLSYNLELSLVLCCRFQMETMQGERRRSVAMVLTRLVHCTVQHPHLIYTVPVSCFSGIFVALVHAIDVDHPVISIAKKAKQQFKHSLEMIRGLVDRVPMRDIKSFIGLIDTFLHPSPSTPPFMFMDHLFNNSTDHDKMLQHMLGTHDLYEAQMLAKTMSTLHQHQQHHRNFPTPFTTPSPPPQQNIFTAISSTSSVSSSSSSPSLQTTSVIPSMPSFDFSQAEAAAAAAVGAVGPPLNSSHPSMTIPSNGKNIEPADYTFELISVDDEWAKSLIY